MFGLYLFTLQRWTASGVSYNFVLFPIVATAAGALLARELITAAVVAGGLMVLAGVYVGVLSGHRRKEPETMRAVVQPDPAKEGAAARHSKARKRWPRPRQVV